MSKQLIESIIDDNLVSAKDIFTERMEEILDRKLYEEKRRISAEMNEAMVGMGMSREQMKKRVEAGFVRASAPKEKGGLGLAPYDVGKEKTKERLAARAKSHQDKKKVGKKNLEEMRAPGEVPGSDERKQDAERLRTLRKGFNILDVDKKGKSKFYKDYLTARKAQVAKTPAKTAAQAAPAAAPASISQAPSGAKQSQVQAHPGQQGQQGQQSAPANAPSSQLNPNLKKLKSKRSGESMASRYSLALNRAERLERRGRGGAVAKVKKAYRVHRIKQGIKNAGQRFMDSPLMRDLHSLGTRNL